VTEQPLVAELRRTGNAIASFANDIFSLRKETLNRDFHNLVIVLEHEEGLTRDAALDRAASIHDAQVRHFIELEASLPSFGAELDQHMKRYVEGMHTWIRANYDWSGVTPRYNEALSRSA
jgi:Terpene synthase family 2, C-terminal metal binding